MDDLLGQKLQPFTQTVISIATSLVDTSITEARDDVEAWEKRWGTVPDHPMLHIEVQDRIRLLIKGEDVHEPTKLELTVAGNQLDKAIQQEWAVK